MIPSLAVVTTDRAKELKLKIHTTRKLEEPVIDLSDEEEVPLVAAAKFTSHKSVLLDDKHGLREHIYPYQGSDLGVS